MEDRDTELLSRVAANHLFLAQFEPFRAALLTLRARNPDLAKAILQNVVVRGGRFDSVLWSHSCSSPELLAYLSTLELVRFDEPAASVWSFDPESLRMRVEFLLTVQDVRSRVSESLRKGVDLEEIEKTVDELGSKAVVENEGSGDLDGDFVESLRVLDKISELGLNRLRSDLVDSEVGGSELGRASAVTLEEEELMCLRRVILETAELFDSLCVNIQKQVQRVVANDDSGLAITVQMEEKSSEEDVKVLKLIQRSVQIAHLDAMKEILVKDSDAVAAISHIRFLHLDYGVEESEYRYVQLLYCSLD